MGKIYFLCYFQIVLLLNKSNFSSMFVYIIQLNALFLLKFCIIIQGPPGGGGPPGTPIMPSPAGIVIRLTTLAFDYQNKIEKFF